MSDSHPNVLVFYISQYLNVNSAFYTERQRFSIYGSVAVVKLSASAVIRYFLITDSF